MKPSTIIILIALFAAVSAGSPVNPSTKTIGRETTPTGGDMTSTGGETAPTGGETTPTGGETAPSDETCVDCSLVCEVLQQQVDDSRISFTEAYIALLNDDLCYREGDDEIIYDDDALCYIRGDIDAIFNAEGNNVDGNEEVFHELCESEALEP